MTPFSFFKVFPQLSVYAGARISGVFFFHGLHSPFGYAVFYYALGAGTKKGGLDFKML